MITASLLTNDSLVIQFDGGEPQYTRSDNPRWNEIVEAFRKGDEKTLKSLISMKAIIEKYSVGQLTVNSAGVLWRGKPLHTLDAKRIMLYLRDGLPFKPIANYIERKMKNPSARAINEMYNFLEHRHMPLMADGRFIAYKGVQDDYFSLHGNKDTVVISGEVNDKGQIYNGIGSVIEVERSSVDDDFRIACGQGLHAGSLRYAKDWGKRVVYVAIDPADVVSVPSDCDCEKLRCCKYEVLGEYTGPLPDHYVSDFDKVEEDSNEDGDGESPGGDSHTKVDDDEFPDESWIKGEVPEESVKEGEKTFYNVSHIGKKIVTLLSEVTDIFVGDIKISDVNVCDMRNGAITYDDHLNFILKVEEFFKMDFSRSVAQNFYKRPLNSLIEKVEEFYYGKVGCIVIDLDAYYEGVVVGRNDKIKSNPTIYITEDRGSGESPRHNSYIEGYIRGYFIEK